MTPDDKKRLFDALEQASWSWRDGALYAPNGTMLVRRGAPPGLATSGPFETT